MIQYQSKTSNNKASSLGVFDIDHRSHWVKYAKVDHGIHGDCHRVFCQYLKQHKIDSIFDSFGKDLYFLSLLLEGARRT